MIIIGVHLLKQKSRKIWKNDLSKVINNEMWIMLIVTFRFQGGIYNRHFLSIFF